MESINKSQQSAVARKRCKLLLYLIGLEVVVTFTLLPILPNKENLSLVALFLRKMRNEFMWHLNTVFLHYWYFSAGLRVKLLSFAKAVIMSIKICKHPHGCLSPAMHWSIFFCFKGRLQAQGCSMQALGWTTCSSSHTFTFLQCFLGTKILLYKQSTCIFLINVF